MYISTKLQKVEYCRVYIYINMVWLVEVGKQQQGEERTSDHAGARPTVTELLVSHHQVTVVLPTAYTPSLDSACKGWERNPLVLRYWP